MDLAAALDITRDIRDQRFPDAGVVLLAGSIVRGEATAHSDLDLVVIHARVKQACRTSFRQDGWPVEAFIHDLQTLNYFFLEVDRPSGVPSLCDMVADGIEVPEASGLSREAKGLARRVLDEGPESWTEADRDASRYAITDLIEDIRAPRSSHELRAALTSLYSATAHHFCRSRGLWSAKAKMIPRKLASYDRAFADRFVEAFEAAFRDAETEKVIRLCRDVLERDGGFLFEGYSRKAPKHWRKDLL